MILATAAGCASARPTASPVATVSATPSGSDGTTPATATPNGTAAATTAARAVGEGAGGQVAACTTRDIRTDLTAQDEQAGTTAMALLQLTNTANHPCRLSGWATVALVDAVDETLRVPIQKVNRPGPSILVDLRPGATASAGIKWTTCDKADDTCPVGNGIVVSLPNSAGPVAAKLYGFPAPERSDITMRSVQVGTIQPSTQGVVAW